MYRTNLNIGQYFKEKLICDPKTKTVRIKIKLPAPISRKGEGKVDTFLLSVGYNGLKINSWNSKTVCEYLTRDDRWDYIWFPKSHMRDLEIVGPQDEVEETTVYRGEGIGVIIIEPVTAYIKLMYDKSTLNGIKPVPGQYALWYRNARMKKELSFDLSLGYDVLFVDSNGKSHYLCEKMDEQDKC